MCNLVGHSIDPSQSRCRMWECNINYLSHLCSYFKDHLALNGIQRISWPLSNDKE